MQKMFPSHGALTYKTSKDYSSSKFLSVYYFIIKCLKSLSFLTVIQASLICYERTPNKCWTKCGTIAGLTVKRREPVKSAHCTQVSKCVSQNVLSSHLVHGHKIRTLCLATCMLYVTKSRNPEVGTLNIPISKKRKLRPEEIFKFPCCYI